MADANSNTPTNAKDEALHCLQQQGVNPVDADILFSDLATALSGLSADKLSAENALQLSTYCEENLYGLCHALRFLGKSFITFSENNVTEMSQESLCQVAHGITAISALIPALYTLERKPTARCSQRTKLRRPPKPKSRERRPKSKACHARDGVARAIRDDAFCVFTIGLRSLRQAHSQDWLPLTLLRR